MTRVYTERMTVLNALQVNYLTVDADSAGQRLDNFLFRHLKGVPKTHVYRIIRSGEIRVNKGRVAADYKLLIGDLLRIPPLRMPEKTTRQVASVALPRSFPVLFEDDSFLAIDKPAGTAVHGGSGVSSGVIEQLRMARPSAPCLELVHRLDRETSGVLLIAKKRSALRLLQDQFRERETGKTYLACVKGQWPGRLKVIDSSLQKYLLSDGERRVRVVASNHPDAMRSITLVKPVSSSSQMSGLDAGSADSLSSLLEVTIKTGRTHQIRVHLASSGHCIAGDDKYGDFEWNKVLSKVGMKRMFLHAWRLKLKHPFTQEDMTLISPLPPDLTPFLQRFPSSDWQLYLNVQVPEVD